MIISQKMQIKGEIHHGGRIEQKDRVCQGESCCQ